MTEKKSRKRDDAKASGKVDFETSLQTLEEIVRQLEAGEVGLDESLKIYETGVKHLQQCYQSLDQAERKVQLLSQVDADGKPVWQRFDEAEMSLEEKAATRSQRRSSTPSGRTRSSSNDQANSANRDLF